MLRNSLIIFNPKQLIIQNSNEKDNNEINLRKKYTYYDKIIINDDKIYTNAILFKTNIPSLSDDMKLVNFNKKDFDKMKKYCNENAFDLPKWLLKLALEEINKNNKTIKENI